jgi:hypothetical protein
VALSNWFLDSSCHSALHLWVVMLPNHLVISPSSLKLFSELCPRRWGFKVMGLREPQTEALFDGSRAHEVAANWLRNRSKLNAGIRYEKWLRQGIHFLPSIDAQLLIEASFCFNYKGLRLGGIIDCVNMTQGEVIDHKFVKSLYYKHNFESLIRDPQYLIYVKAIPARRGKWVYYSKTANQADAVSAERPADFDELFEQIVYKPACEMQKLYTLLYLARDEIKWEILKKDFPPNTKKCYAYNNPCMHLPYCKR